MYKAKDVANILSISVKSIYLMIERGELKATNYGQRMIRITADDLAQFQNLKRGV